MLTWQSWHLTFVAKMANNMEHDTLNLNQSKSRSSTGCWTCRIRRKKCDETARNCSVCTSLRLKCDGYGPKPVWMDGVIREKQKAEDLKRRIRRHRKRGQIVSTRLSESRHQTQSQHMGPRHDSGTSQQALSGKLSTDTGHTSSQLVGTDETLPWAAESRGGFDQVSYNADEVSLDDSFKAMVGFVQQPTAQAGAGSASPAPAENILELQWPGTLSPVPRDLGHAFQNLEWADLGDSLSPTNSLGKSLAELQIHQDYSSNAVLTHVQGTSGWSDEFFESDLKQFKNIGTDHGENDIFEALPLSPLPWEHVESILDTNLDYTGSTVDVNHITLDKHCQEDGSQSCTEIAQPTIQTTLAVSFFVQTILPNQFPYAEGTVRSRLRDAILCPHELVRPFIHSIVETTVHSVQAHALERYGLNTSSKHRVLSPVASLTMLDNIFISDLQSSDSVIQTQCLEEAIVPLMQQTLLQVRGLHIRAFQSDREHQDR
jgi:hypothetical protein